MIYNREIRVFAGIVIDFTMLIIMTANASMQIWRGNGDVVYGKNRFFSKLQNNKSGQLTGFVYG